MALPAAADPGQLNEFFRTSKAINEMFPELYAGQGLELLTMFPEGEVCMTTQEPVKTPEDLNEVKCIVREGVKPKKGKHPEHTKVLRTRRIIVEDKKGRRTEP